MSYKTDENTIINFSGGRTSGYLLKKTLDAYSGELPSNFVVLFQNTGLEFHKTLDFIHQVSVQWGVDIVWLEFQAPTHKGDNGRWVYPEDERFRIVTYETASRNGEPFADLIDNQKALPNVRQRWCTRFLKQKVARSYVQRRLGWDEWQSYLGIRYDEPSRWRVRGPDPHFKREDREIPLVDANITIKEVAAFWDESPFDVDLPQGVSNCDLCFLKGMDKKLKVLRANPNLADWWIEQERKTGRTFRSETTYKRLKDIASRSPMLPVFNDADLSTCLCTD